MAKTSPASEYFEARGKDFNELFLSRYEMFAQNEPRVEQWVEAYLYGPTKAFAQNGGKRLRPLLALLACEACGGDVQKVIDVAFALEHFQSAALIHDDIADNSKLRRGKKTLHEQEGMGLAINAGDSELVASFEALADSPNLDDAEKVDLINLLVQMMNTTIKGQAIDLGWSRDKLSNLTEDDYLYMARCKSSIYTVEVPLQMGALVANAPFEQMVALKLYGENLGVAFQIHDDLMNLIGDEKAQGKDFRSDIVEGKRTFMVCYTFAHGTPEQTAELEKIILSSHVSKKECARAVEIMEEAGAIAAAQELEQERSQDAVALLQDGDFDESPFYNALLDLPRFLLARKA